MLTGKEVYLRGVEKKDIAFFYKIWCDDEVRNYDISFIIPPGREFIMDNFNRFMSLSRKYLSIVSKREELLGYITYEEAKDCPNVYMIGITLDKAYWNLGYGRDAIEVLLSYLFMSRAAKRVELEVADFNERAIKCYNACGFVQEGVMRNRFFSRGSYHGLIIMSILNEEFVP